MVKKNIPIDVSAWKSRTADFPEISWTRKLAAGVTESVRLEIQTSGNKVIEFGLSVFWQFLFDPFKEQEKLAIRGPKKQSRPGVTDGLFDS